jgi:hypothetical protein
MGERLILTGLPRSGTTLACRLLGQCRDCVALAEPMDVLGIPADARDRAIDHIVGWMDHTRRGILATGTAPSKVGKRGLVDNPFSPRNAAGLRLLQVREGTLRIPAPLRPDFTLVVKHNAAFAALLPALAGRVPTVAVIRHPLAVLGSWASLALPVSDGRLPAGERLDPALARTLDGQDDLLERQRTILAWFFARYDTLPPGAVVRYEDMIESAGTALFDAAGLTPERRLESLDNRNAMTQCPREQLPRLADALRGTPGPWDRWYPVDSIAPMLASMVSP